jgi:transcription factor C subunit 7
VSVYRRKLAHQDGHGPQATRNSADKESGPDAVVGGWTCEANSDCSFLAGGEERGWYVQSPKQSKDRLRPALTMQFPTIRKFAGDEEFPDTGSMSNDASEPKL